MTITNRKTRRHMEPEKPGRVEWLSGLVSAILILLLVGWMAREALTDQQAPPDLDIHILSTEKAGRFFRVEFELANSATSTAAAVHVEGELRRAGAETETSQVTFDYAPAQSRTQGALLFRNDPAGGVLDIRPTGYTEP